MFVVYIAVIALAWGIRQAGGLELDLFFSLIEEYPIFAPVLFVIAYALLVALFIPTLPVNLAAGVLWEDSGAAFWLLWGALWALFWLFIWRALL